MKFLLEFVSSCGSFSSRVVEEETRSLVVPAPEERRPRGRKRERLVRARAAAGGGQVVEWRPTLSSISEVNVLPERNNGSNVVASERMKRNKASSTATPKPRPHHHRDDFGQAQASVIIPALAPAPFLF